MRLMRLVIAIACVLTAGVSIAQTKIYNMKEITVVPSVTSDEQIRATLGSPLSIKSDGEVVVWTYEVRGAWKIVRPEGSVEQPIESYKLLVLDKSGKDDRLGYGFENLTVYFRFGKNHRVINIEPYKFV